MHTQEQHRGLISKVALLLLGATGTFVPGWAAQQQGVPEPPSARQEQNTPESERHMSEELRSSVKKVVVIAGQSPASREIIGSYEEATAGLVGGMDAGSRAATISKEIGGAGRARGSGPRRALCPPPRAGLPGIAARAPRGIEDPRQTKESSLRVPSRNRGMIRVPRPGPGGVRRARIRFIMMAIRASPTPEEA